MSESKKQSNNQIKGRNGGTLNRFKKGDPSPNPNGRPKGVSKKTKLGKLIKDISSLYPSLTNREKALAYQLYEIAFSDLLNPENVNSGIDHLYFMESEIGIKIGRSKNVEKRIEAIRKYSPSVKIIKVIGFAGSFEGNLHKKFRHINIKGNIEIGTEWFYKKNELMEIISELSSVNDLASMFGGKEVGQLLLFKDI